MRDIDQFQEALQSRFAAKQDEYLALLRKMVEINSFTQNPEGIERLGRCTAEAFAALGFTAEFVPSKQAACGPHLILHRRGRSPRQLAMISHLDTVYPAEEERRNRFVWREAGDKIYGPGVIDIKGGTVMMYMILDALHALSPEMFESVSWTLLLDSSEEDDAQEFGDLCLERLGDDAIAALVFEYGTMDVSTFRIVTARKGRAMFEIEAFGRGAHAGNEHHEGANALLQMAHAIQEIERCTDYQADLTCNVGIMEGGLGVNRVPHHARAFAEMRAFSTEAFASAREKILALDGTSSVKSFRGDFAAHLRVRLGRETPPWPPNAGTQQLFALWQAAGARLGRKAIAQERGGVSDGNLICHKIPVLDGLGPSGANAHCSEQSEDGSKEQEYLSLPSLVPKAVINTLAIDALLRQTAGI
jgi:glutamate carboxypeptidase